MRPVRCGRGANGQVYLGGAGAEAAQHGPEAVVRGWHPPLLRGLSVPKSNSSMALDAEEDRRMAPWIGGLLILAPLNLTLAFKSEIHLHV